MGPTGPRRRDAVVGTERRDTGLRPGDARGRLAAGVLRGELELDVRVDQQRLPGCRGLAAVSVVQAVVAVERGDLALDLGVGDVLLGRLVDDVHDYRKR